MHPGVLLAGGRSRRMGTDKAWLKLGGMPLAERALERARGQAMPLIVSANASRERFSALGATVVPDEGEAGTGPLAGVLSAMAWLRERGIGDGGIVSFACDTPFFPLDLCARLDEAFDGTTIAVASSGGRLHPAFALWPLASEAELRASLAGERVPSMRDILAQAGAKRVEWTADPLDPFFNVNTPADLREAERLLAGP